MASKVEQKTIPTLYNLSSSIAIKVLVALEELAESSDIKYNLKNVSRQTDYSAVLKPIFPLGKSPILVVENADGTPNTEVYQILPRTLTESRLILQFLNDEYANGLWTPSAEDKARDTFFQEFANSTVITKADFAMLFTFIPKRYPFGLRHLLLLLLSPVAGYFKKDLADIFELMEGQISADKPWFAGSKIGLADFNMLFGVEFAIEHRFLDKSKYPKVIKWYDTMINRPSYKRAMEKGEEYDVSTWK